jgi:hypothetical protein
MCGLRASRWHRGDFCAGCGAAGNRTARPYGKANRYNHTNHTSFCYTNHRTHRRADGHPKPGPNRQPGCDRLRRAAR